jgi:hypothetical protein
MKFGFLSQAQSTEWSFALGIIFSMDITKEKFVEAYTKDLYKKILVDCANKTVSLDEKIEKVLFDNVLASENQKGLISYIADGLYDCSKITLFYYPKQDIISNTELANDVKNKGVQLDFSNNYKNKVLKVYIGMIFDILSNFSTALNISKSLNYKIQDLRTLIDKDTIKDVENQSRKIIEAIKKGESVAIDKGDEVVLSSFDIAPAKQAIEEINKLIAGVMGLPISYINGELSTVIASSSNNESVAINRGIKNYWTSIFAPCVSQIFGKNISFQKDILTTLTNSIQVLQFLEMTELIDEKQKKILVNDILEIKNEK